MSSMPVSIAPETPAGPGLTQVQRVIYTFTAPSKTFNDIKRNTSWWLPFVLTVVCSYLLFAGIAMKVTWAQVAENNAKLNAKQAEQMEKMPAEQRATSMKLAATITQVAMAATPVFALIGQAIVAGVLLATINFGFGGKATFWQVYAVCWFAGLPGLIKFILGTVALFVGMDPESFKINNFAGTNPGYFLPADTSKPLLALASSLDVVTLWSCVLMAIGISIVAGTKRSAGYIAVFAWWVVVVLFGAGMAAIF